MTRPFFILLFFSPFFAQGQLKYKFLSEPDSATVYANGDKQCVTPCIARVYWGRYSKEGKLVFTVEAPGYEAWKETLKEKPKHFDHTYKAILDPKVPKFEFDSLVAPITFDQIVLTDVEEKDKIGEIRSKSGFSEAVTWHAYYENDFDQAIDAFYQMAERGGFPNTRSELKRQSLFQSEVKALPRRARFMVGVELSDIEVDISESVNNRTSRGYEVMINTKLKAKWKVFDRVDRKVVEEYATTGVFKHRNYRRTYDFSLVGAINNAASDFFTNSKLNELVAESRSRTDSYVSAYSFDHEAFEVAQREPRAFNGIGEMIQQTSPACVTVVTDAGHGSGVVIDPSGLILSSYHVIEAANSVDVSFNNGITLAADIIVYDDSSDVVLLKVDGKNFTYLSPPASVGAPTLGLEVVTIGTPSNIDLGQSIAKGIVSGRRMNDDGIQFIQIDMAVSPGNSGGPLLNERGEIIGIIESKIVDRGVEGIGFAVPIETALDRLKIKVKK